MTEKELDELLKNNRSSVIWQQSINAANAIMHFGFYLVTYGSLVVIYLRLIRKVNIIELFRTEIVLSTEIIATFLLAIFIIALHTTNAYIAATIQYSILPTEIKFSWGFPRKKIVSIPFTKITTINHVKYDHGEFSTIYFGTTEKYKIKKINFDEGIPRAHITFEKVEKGDDVMSLLNMLWKRANKPS